MFQAHNNRKKGQPPQTPKRFIRGQNIIEYMILVVGVVTVVVVATRPQGFFTQGVNQALNLMFSGVDKIATEQCLGTLDDVNGQWSGWGSWGPCTSCTQIRTRTCTSPAPKCNGKECVLQDGTRGLFETDTPLACYSGTWGLGVCGTCTGNCGSTSGTQSCAYPCDGGCCDPADQPPTTVVCTKLAYPDVWTEFNDWTCNTSCGEGIASQTVTCSGMCCDAAKKYPTRAACTNGCCAEVMDIGLDVDNNVQFTATFGPKDNGQSDSVSCPPGYAGTPTSTCTAIADLICTDSAGCPATASSGLTCKGNDSYSSAPPSCYNIGWGPVWDTCVPANCDVNSPNRTQNICDTSKAPGCSLTATFPDTLHDAWGTIYCTDYKQGNGAGYTGTATMQCHLGDWVVSTLVAGCVPNCPAEPDVSIGAGLTYDFPETVDAVDGGSVNISCVDYDGGPGCGLKRYEGTVSRSCNAGTWSALNGSCGYKSCVPETWCDPNGTGVCGTFGDTPVVAHGTPDTVTCSAVDIRYTGDFSRTCDYGQWCSPAGGCTAKNCTTDYPVNVNGVNIIFKATLNHGLTQSQDCAAFDNTYTGTVNATCDYGNWINLTGGCTPNCPTQTLDVGSGQTGSFTTIASGQTRWSSCPGGYSGTPNRLCSAGTWGPLNNGCTPNACVDEYLDIGAGQSAWFYAGPSTTTRWPGCPSWYSGNPERTCTAGSWGTLSGACVCVPKTCPDLALCSGSTPTNDGCGGTIYCQSCNCTCPDGTVIASGVTCPNLAYQSSSVPCGSNCQSEWRSCSSGNLSGTYTNTSCSKQACAGCTSPCGHGTIAHTFSDTCYSASSVPCGSLCSSISQTATCNNGSWSSSLTYTNGICTVGCCSDGSCSATTPACGTTTTGVDNCGFSCCITSATCCNYYYTSTTIDSGGLTPRCNCDTRDWYAECNNSFPALPSAPATCYDWQWGLYDITTRRFNKSCP